MRRFLAALWAKLANKPLALCDSGDVDGIVSAALFLRKYPNGVVVLAAPSEVGRSWWIRNVHWTFVADLPCPGKALIRADHHKTNKPCAKVEFYDPEAPCSALMALKALDLVNDPIANSLVKVAVETDTANITSKEAEELDLAVRFASYSEKIYIIRNLAINGLRALENERIRKLVERGYEAKKLMLEIADKIPIKEVINIYSPVNLGISYRQLTIELQRRGAKMVNILLRLGRRTFRYYCGADKNSLYDCTQVATRLGGGGHKYASGAQYRVSLFNTRKGLEVFINVLKTYLNTDRLELLELSRDSVKTLIY
ncbi:MAG: Fis family transcriptional regulator [Vulcanisaeta sp.]|nr:Fis family transcriptional regulator [Vulcanisaeta sp.]MCG2870013.1 Fis family transcriptional regulator [Vulcanisaeta sp.]MCG2887221.1 Fis family transcriptional regulator [Vulcanisaeta sp.]